MTRHRASATFLLLGAVVAVAVTVPPVGIARAADPDPASVAILQALHNNPVTAPYRFAVANRGRQYALSGRVGTKMVHDVAIRTMIALGYPVRDDITIDTTEGYRAAAQAGPGALRPGFGGAPALASNNPGYVYPPPLFGRIDDPFFGLEPPLLSYAPWYGAMASRREPINAAALNGPGPGGPGAGGPGLAPAAVVSAPAGPGAGAGVVLTNPIEMTIDSRGVATLRGQVPTLGDRVAVGQEIARTPGIMEVVNLLEVTGVVRSVPAGAARPMSDTPPPPPTPAFPAAPASGASDSARSAPAGAPGQVVPPPGTPYPVPNSPPVDPGRATLVEGDPLTRNVAESIARRPALAAAPLKVTSRDGVVTLSGQLPSSYEAMLAFRAAQQTPGVRDVIDRLQFPIPDVDRPNPLRDKGRPDDVEPYLLAQVRRQLGDLAHVDQVRVRGDALEIRGTVTRADDVPRVEAALRSIPLLRGYRLEPSFPTD